MSQHIGLVITAQDWEGSLYVALLARHAPKASPEKLHYVEVSKTVEDLVQAVRERMNAHARDKGFCKMTHAACNLPHVACKLPPAMLPIRKGKTGSGILARYLHVHTTVESWESFHASVARTHLPKHRLAPKESAQVACPLEMSAINAALHRVNQYRWEGKKKKDVAA